MAYRRIDTTDGVTRMNKALYDNLQDGIDVALSKIYETLEFTKLTRLSNCIIIADKIIVSNNSLYVDDNVVIIANKLEITDYNGIIINGSHNTIMINEIYRVEQVSSGVAITVDGKDNVVSHCYFHKNFYHRILIQGQNITIRDCVFEDTDTQSDKKETGIKISSNNEVNQVEDVLIVKCTFGYFTDNDIDIYTGGRDIIIQDCMFSYTTKTNIEIKNVGTSDLNIINDNISIINNIFRGDPAIMGICVASVSGDDQIHVTFAGNKIFGRTGLSFNGGMIYCYDNYSEDDTNRLYLITGYNAKEVIIRNNHSKFRGFYITDCTYALVDGFSFETSICNSEDIIVKNCTATTIRLIKSAKLLNIDLVNGGRIRTDVVIPKIELIGGVYNDEILVINGSIEKLIGQIIHTGTQYYRGTITNNKLNIINIE